MFIAFAVTLGLFLTAFVVFLVVIRRMDSKTFTKYCEGRIRRFAKHNKLLAIDKLNILNYSREKLEANHVIFGKKYIYLITDLMVKGFVKGDVNDNSWVYFNKNTKKTHYLSNLSKVSDKNIQEFAGILGINPDPIVAICLVPNECDFSIKQLGSDHKMVVHYSSFARKIKELEKRPIGSLNEEQIYEQYKAIKERNR